MDPSSVVLDRSVRLVASTGEKTTGGGSTLDFDVETYNGIGLGIEGEEVGDSASKEEEPTGLVYWVRKGKVRLVPELLNPPNISTLSLHLPATPREIRAQLQSVRVPCADKNLLVLCTGPESLSFASSGNYLVYDAVSDTLVVAPPIDWREFMEIFGRVPVIVRQGSNFTLAVVVVSNRTRDHFLLLWSAGQDQWTKKQVRLPADASQYPFMTDVSFAYSYSGSFACWVDLYFGLLALELGSSNELESQSVCDIEFVSLPKDLVMDCLPMSRERPEVHRTVGCIGRDIKFLCMDGYSDDDCPRDKVTVTSWTLKNPGLWKWKRDDDNGILVADLWADEKFLATPELTQQVPMCPVLSPKEPNILFFFLSDIAFTDGHIATKGEYVLSLNMQSKKVQSLSKCSPERSLEFIPSVIATEFCAYQQTDDKIKQRRKRTHDGSEGSQRSSRRTRRKRN